MPCRTLTDQVSIVGDICPGSLLVSAVSSCLEFDHFLFTVRILTVVHCGCVCSSGMLHGVGRLLIMAQHPRRVKIWTTSWQKPEISHCSLLLSVLLFKIYLKSCLQEACYIEKMLLSVLILCGSVLSLCVLLVHDFHYSSNRSLL